MKNKLVDLNNHLFAQLEHCYMTQNKLNEQPEELKETVVLLSRVQAKTKTLCDKNDHK